MPLTNIVLTGQQKQILFLPFNAPIQIKGVAGSGKTTVAVYRAKHYLATRRDFFGTPKVGIFTYNKNLVKYLDSLCRSVEAIEEDENSPGLDATITNFNRWVYRTLLDPNLEIRTISERDKKSALNGVLYNLKRNIDHYILDKRVQFYIDEISWIKGKLIDDWNEYREIERTGRGTADRVTAESRKYIWQVYSKYQDHLNNINKVDFDDYAILSLKMLNKGKKKYFDHIVVDEAQDLSKAQMIVLSKLLPDKNKSITVIADAAQRIYKSGFTWKEVGLSVTGGRTHELTKNYRNNANIIRAANSLLDHETDSKDFTLSTQEAKESKFKPELIESESLNEELQDVVNKVIEIQNNYPKDSIAILHRNNSGLRFIENNLAQKSIEYQTYRNVQDYDMNKIITCTMFSVKGLEFDHVLITNLNHNIIPDPQSYSDEEDELHESTERRLLYTAMTRAHEQLYMFYTKGQASMFINELNKKHFKYLYRSDFDRDDLPI